MKRLREVTPGMRVRLNVLTHTGLIGKATVVSFERHQMPEIWGEGEVVLSVDELQKPYIKALRSEITILRDQ